MAWDDSKQPQDDFLSEDWNNMVTDQKKRSKLLDIEEKTGSDCTGSDGETNRVLTLSNSELTIRVQVFVEGRNEKPSNMNVTHNETGTEIEFLREIYNSDEIVVYPYA